jgi:hypothetical protein
VRLKPICLMACVERAATHELDWISPPLQRWTYRRIKIYVISMGIARNGSTKVMTMYGTRALLWVTSQMVSEVFAGISAVVNLDYRERR